MILTDINVTVVYHLYIFLLYKMIVCAGWSEKTARPICKILFGSYRFEYGICQKNSKILYKLIN